MMQEIKEAINDCLNEIAKLEKEIGTPPVCSGFNDFFNDDVVIDDDYRMEQITGHANRLADWMEAKIKK